MNELNWRERGRLWLRLVIRVIIILLLLVTAVFLAPPVISIMMPFVLALFMAWLLNPLVRLMQKRLNVNRNIITVLLILLLFVVVGGGLFAFLSTAVGEIVSFINNWTTIWQNLQAQLNQVSAAAMELLALLPFDLATEAADMVSALLAWTQSQLPNMVSTIGGYVLPVATSLSSWVIATVVFIMATYFTTADYPHLRFMVTERVPEEFRGFWSSVKNAAVSALGGYLRAQLILSLAVFFILLIGFSLLGQNYALILALLLAIMDFIPIIGAGTAMVPWAIVDLILNDYKHAVGLLVIWGVIVVFRRIAEPKVVGNQTGLPPILSLISIYVGMQLGGVLGMVLGPILTMIALSLSREGMFSGLAGDVGLAVRDISALLKNRPKKR